MFKRCRVKLLTQRHIHEEFIALFLRIFLALLAEEICTKYTASLYAYVAVTKECQPSVDSDVLINLRMIFILPDMWPPVSPDLNPNDHKISKTIQKRSEKDP